MASISSISRRCLERTYRCSAYPLEREIHLRGEYATDRVLRSVGALPTHRSTHDIASNSRETVDTRPTCGGIALQYKQMCADVGLREYTKQP